MNRYFFVGLMIGLGLASGCATNKADRNAPKLDFGRQVAVLNVSAEGFGTKPNSRTGKSEHSAYRVNVLLWEEREPAAEEDLSACSSEINGIRKSIGVQPTPGKFVDVISAPVVTLPPNEWRSLELVHRVGGTIAEMSFRVDGELLTVGSHPGLTLKAMAVPLEENLVQVKGAMVVAKMSPTGTRYHAFPFDVVLELGNSAIVYEREFR